MIDIRNIWTRQSLSETDNTVIRDKIDDIVALNCYIGTISQTGARLFILELKDKIDNPYNYIRKFSGVEIQIIKRKHVPELYIILQDNDLYDIFCYFIEDLIKTLIPIDNSNIAIIEISEKIIYWKRLFNKLSGDILSPQQQRGLFGELLFLNDLLYNINDQSFVINGWHGPLAANQDFWYNGLALEIKTSVANNPTIKISNEYQLDKSGLKMLYLIFYKLNEYKGGNDTLYKLIYKIRNKLNSENKFMFDDRLLELGLDMAIAKDEYDSVSYSIRFQKTYKIEEDFPSITRSSINDALSKVSYEVDPKLCSSFETDILDVYNIISKEKCN